MCWENTYPMIYSRSFFTYPSKQTSRAYQQATSQGQENIYPLFITTNIYLCTWLPGHSGLQPL